MITPAMIRDGHFVRPKFGMSLMTTFAVSISGFFSPGLRFPLISFQDSAQFATTINKRTMTGALLGVTHNINYQYQNSPANVFPSDANATDLAGGFLAWRASGLPVQAA